MPLRGGGLPCYWLSYVPGSFKATARRQGTLQAKRGSGCAWRGSLGDSEELARLQGGSKGSEALKRQIDRLAWVERTESPFGKVSRAKGAKALGLQFERRVGKLASKWFPGDEVLLGPWLRFADAHGEGFAQPDIVCLKAGLVLECKLGFRAEAFAELEGLYIPLCERLWRRTFRGLVVCKHWRGDQGHMPLAHPSEFGADARLAAVLL